MDWRTLYWVMLATVLPTSAFWMLFDALCRFVTSLLMSPLAELRRLTEAPMTPRCAETCVIAAEMAVRAAAESAELVRSVEASFKVPAESEEIDVLIVVFAVPTVVPSPI